ncbi:ATP-grasp domain-containing protein [Paenibacillus sp. IB182496]|uniref:ATP-grasp domain-containing protein n=1 Tax=Paenibacillus sabuli TaxID=2772509 RepID=A0A927GTD8_9BACL|nr:ATP-grasp domain-containing protein [Paenibacillus sabuli]MBD2847473.1 ATP-grasp domain-containing protein [Paenibacillus sabuli]
MTHTSRIFNYEHANIWYYNVNKEQEWNINKEFPTMTDAQQLALVKQQEQQSLFLARPQDTVLMHHHPDPQFLCYLVEQGHKLPEIQLIKNIHSHHINSNLTYSLVPYMVTEDLEQWCLREKCDLFGADSLLVKRLNSKLYTRELATKYQFLVTSGSLCRSVEELIETYVKLTESGFEKCVLKTAFGSSGKGLRLINNSREFQSLLKFISRRSSNFELLLEGWHPVQQNINCQLLIRDGRPFILSVTEQYIDANGVYLGTNYSPEYSPQTDEHYRHEMMRLGNVLVDLGFDGICGIDSIIDQQNRIFPIIELNARFTQVTYLLDLVQRLNRDFQYIESRYVRIEFSDPLSFYEVNEILKRILAPDRDHRYLVYTFAKYTPEGTSRTKYRIYVLFYGKQQNKLRAMIQNFLTFEARQHQDRAPINM